MGSAIAGYACNAAVLVLTVQVKDHLVAVAHEQADFPVAQAANGSPVPR